jgi:hypothetical protein
VKRWAFALMVGNFTPKTEMALSNNTIIKLSEALSKDVADYISDQPEFFDLLVQLIPEAIHAKLGNVDDQVAAELSMCISERLILKGV